MKCPRCVCMRVCMCMVLGTKCTEVGLLGFCSSEKCFFFCLTCGCSLVPVDIWHSQTLPEQDAPSKGTRQTQVGSERILCKGHNLPNERVAHRDTYIPSVVATPLRGCFFGGWKEATTGERQTTQILPINCSARKSQPRKEPPASEFCTSFDLCIVLVRG